MLYSSMPRTLQIITATVHSIYRCTAPREHKTQTARASRPNERARTRRQIGQSRALWGGYCWGLLATALRILCMLHTLLVLAVLCSLCFALHSKKTQKLCGIRCWCVYILLILFRNTHTITPIEMKYHKAMHRERECIYMEPYANGYKRNVCILRKFHTCTTAAGGCIND